MIELYEWPPTRSHRVKWALEELEAPYSSKIVNMEKSEQLSKDYLSIHPLGVVPALKTETYTMYESIAIVMQLIDEHSEKKLSPQPGTPERALYYQWCVFASAELDPSLMMYFDNTMRPEQAMRPPGSKHNKAMAEQGKYNFNVRAQVLSQTLERQEFLLENGFSGADIVVGHSCFMAKLMGLLDEFPTLTAYYERLEKRPAHQKVYKG